MHLQAIQMLKPFIHNMHALQHCYVHVRPTRSATLIQDVVGWCKRVLHFSVTL